MNETPSSVEKQSRVRRWTNRLAIGGLVAVLAVAMACVMLSWFSRPSVEWIAAGPPERVGRVDAWQSGLCPVADGTVSETVSERSF